MDELVRALEKTVSPSQTDQNEAVQYIEAYIQRDFAGFLRHISDVLYNTTNLPVVRAAAGLQLKNQLTSRDESTKLIQQDKWRNLPQDVKIYVKDRVFTALGTEVFKPSSAPKCVAYIASIELPDQQWPGLIQALIQYVEAPNSTDARRFATLEAIGCICQDFDRTCLKPEEASGILTAIISGMKHDEKDVKLAATIAATNFFHNQLKEIAKTNQSISYGRLADILNIDKECAERMMAQMIRDDRIQGYMNQIEEIVYFETDDHMHLFNEDILKICSDVNSITEKIKNAVSDDWWIANYN